MKSHRFDWRSGLLSAALLAAFLLSAALVRSQAAPPSRTEDEPPLPSKKTPDEDPPLPSRKTGPVKEVRVQVTAPSAEVQAGDMVIATVSRGEVLRFTKKNEDYYLVIVNDKKGWIKKDAVREVEVTVGGPDAPAIEIPTGPAPAVIDKDTARKVKQATAYLRARLANGNTVEGSGFFAVQPGLVLTNAHVLGMLSPGSPLPTEVRVVVHSGEPEEFALPAQVLGVDRENDLGVLQVKGRAGRLPAPLPVDTSRALALVQKVYIFGFPFGTSLGKDITASESSVSSIRKDAAGLATQIQVNGGMHPGNSGGPVVDSRGVVVGVAVSVIRGTQINFAVAGERVQDLLRGRVGQTQFGETYREKNQVKVPVRLSCLDPLQRIRTVKLEIWAGKNSRALPPSPMEPRPLPGDGPRSSLAATYQDGNVQADVALPSLAGGQVLWVQPVLTDRDGARHWAGAVSYTPSDLPPLERKAVLLQHAVDRQAQRTLKLTGSFQVQVSKGFKQTLFRDDMEVEILEMASKEPRGGRLDLSFGSTKFTSTEMNDKASPTYSPRAQNFLRARTMTFILDPQGAFVQRTIPTPPPGFPVDLREDFAGLTLQIANAYEMTCLAVPNRRVAAQETWQARVPLLLGYQDKKKIVDMILTCTYEGSRVHTGQDNAVITLSGKIQERPPGKQATAGIVTGKVHFELDSGYLSFAHIRLESQGGSENSTVALSYDVSLTRGRGNTAGIVARPLQVVPGPPAATGTDYELAVPLIQKREFDQAIPLLEKAIAANPRLVQAHVDLGFAYNEKGLFDKAILSLKKAIELAPRHVNAHNNLGAASLGKGLHDEAIVCFKKALELEPNFATAHANLGWAYHTKQLYDQAIPCLEKAIELDPQNVVAHGNLGLACNAKGLHDRAITCLKKALELDPRQADKHNSLGHAYNAKGLYEDAIACFKKALELDPKHASALNNLGYSCNALGLHDQGIPWLKKAVELHPKFAVAHNNLSFALKEVGELEKACDALKKALALTPETASQFQPRKRTLEEMETLLRLEPGLPDIAKGERKPKNFDEAILFGKVCRMKQHYVAALRCYEQAFTTDPIAARKSLTPVNLVVLARAALFAAAGQGSDPPSEADRPKYRARALAWLQQFIKAEQEALEKDFNANRYSCQKSVRVLLLHKDLASVRPPALNSLPASERKEWVTFWEEVENLLEKADALPTP